MKVEHIAIWTSDIERLKDFYVKYFGAVSNSKYKNNEREFESYFLSFQEGCRIEIMQKPKLIGNGNNSDTSYIGLSHFAVSVGDKFAVISLTKRLRTDGYMIFSEPRVTGDGYYESIIADPDGNRVEITV